MVDGPSIDSFLDATSTESKIASPTHPFCEASHCPGDRCGRDNALWVGKKSAAPSRTAAQVDGLFLLNEGIMSSGGGVFTGADCNC